MKDDEPSEKRHIGSHELDNQVETGDYLYQKVDVLYLSARVCRRIYFIQGQYFVKVG